MSEQPPEGTPDGLTPDLFRDLVREGTLQGMKDYDRERDEWESAVSEQEKARTDAEKDKPPAGKGRDIGAFLLGGKRS